MPDHSAREALHEFVPIAAEDETKIRDPRPSQGPDPEWSKYSNVSFRRCLSSYLSKTSVNPKGLQGITNYSD